jgi:hypothetical protein
MLTAVEYPRSGEGALSISDTPLGKLFSFFNMCVAEALVQTGVFSTKLPRNDHRVHPNV